MAPDGDFFRVWAEFLKPIHNLTNTEMEVLAAILKKRDELSRKYDDPEDVDEKLMGKKAKKEVMDECNLTPKYFRVILTDLNSMTEDDFKTIPVNFNIPYIGKLYTNYEKKLSIKRKLEHVRVKKNQTDVQSGSGD